ncbi:MAG: GNAT family N-acetyltransferase [Burkholderiales bacterium]|nr:GNAT family N-acetyltransferase [Burkholderiales bacterium]
MSTRNLDYLLSPRSVAVIGASERTGSVGSTVMRNLLADGFEGPVWPVNPKYTQVAGRQAYASVKALPQAPDLAVICTPPPTLPGLIAELGQRGTRAAAVLTAGVASATDRKGRRIIDLMLEAAQPHLLRILGPNCVGFLVPGLGLNASFAPVSTVSGPLAFVSQSGALVTAVLDWANSRGIGFSHFISVGDRADVDFGDLIDYLGSDPHTRAILLYVESVKTPRKFLSAARAASRNKPVIVVKTGRAPEGARAAATHSGVLAGADEVFDAAIRRAGMLRVENLLDLFVAVETLARGPRFEGDRLMVVSNGGGAGVLAADAAALGGARLAELSAATIERLDALLPPMWSRANPVDIIGDAPVERYVETLKVLGDAKEADAILFIHAPSAIVPADAIAEACVPVVKAATRPVLSCWLGAASVEDAWRRFAQAGIASYHTPEEAVRAFVHSVTYRRNQQQLLQAPPSSRDEIAPDLGRARGLLRAALTAGQQWLTDTQGRELLTLYGIPVVETRAAPSVDAAREAAEAIGYPVALKLDSPDISHKSDVRGVILNIDSADELRASAVAILRRAHELRPQARLEGFVVQPMVRRPNAFELLIGVANDPQFGPVIVFGHGGTAVEIVGDRAVALPPLNTALARELVSRTRIARLLAGYRDRPPVDLAAICRVLVAVSQMVIDLPELAELDINPLLVDEQGVVALAGRARVAKQDRAHGEARLAIRPYPRELEEAFAWDDGEMLMRPIRPDDGERHLAFLARLDPEDIRLRVFSSRRSIAPSELARLTQIDYEREMAFVATIAGADGQQETIGTVRAVTDPDNARAEFGVIVRSDMKGRSLGFLLMKKMIRYCRERGTGELVGDVLRENAGMLRLARALGFEVQSGADSEFVRIRLPLQAAEGSAAASPP